VARKKSIALSYAHQSLTEPGEWLEKVTSAIRAEAIAVKAQAGQASSLSSSFGLTFDMVDEAAQEAISEADRLATMALFAAIEAAFQIDYFARTVGNHRPKAAGRLRRGFKSVAKHLNTKRLRHAPSLEILVDEWQAECGCLPGPTTKINLGHLKGCFRYRHWLAHGRYWQLRQQPLSHDELFLLADNLVALLRQWPFVFQG
jgi:hypothetical protein